jgi:hypothetical protein
MWISKKRWIALVKRVADLEVQVQSQHITSEKIVESINSFNTTMTKKGSTRS